MPPEWQLWVSDDPMPGDSMLGDPMPGNGFGPSAGQPFTSPYQQYGQPPAANTMPAKPGFNGFAIAGFVLGLIGILAFSAILSVVLSIVGLVQISRRQQRGKGLAIAGIVLSGIWVAVILAVAVVSVTAQVRSTVDSRTAGPGQVNIFSLRVGQCFQNPTAVQAKLGVTAVTTAACTEPHSAQVFAQFNATDASYPGQQALILEASHGCQAREAATLDKSKLSSTMRLHFLFPEPNSWSDGRRALTCVIVDPTKDLTSSLLSAGG